MTREVLINAGAGEIRVAVVADGTLQELSFERTIGENTPLRIKRGHNALWTKGGLQYAPPIR